jgi:hypothetical protein
MNMENLIELLENLKGCKIATITYQTIVKIPKKYGIDGVVTKQAKMQCQLNYDYANAVNNRLEKQGDEREFESKSMAWGAWVKGQENKLKEHKGELYLRIYLMKNAKSEKAYFVNGVPATQEQISIIKVYESSKYRPIGTQAEVGLVENQVMPKDIKLSNILELKVDKQTITPNKQYSTAE